MEVGLSAFVSRLVIALQIKEYIYIYIHTHTHKISIKNLLQKSVIKAVRSIFHTVLNMVYLSLSQD